MQKISKPITLTFSRLCCHDFNRIANYRKCYGGFAIKTCTNPAQFFADFIVDLQEIEEELDGVTLEEMLKDAQQLFRVMKFKVYKKSKPYIYTYIFPGYDIDCLDVPVDERCHFTIGC